MEDRRRNYLQPQKENTDAVDLKDVMKIILRKKFTILFLTFIFMIGSGIYAYITPNVYSSSATIELVGDSKNSTNASDFLIQALTGSEVNVENEIELIQSRFIAQKAFDNLSLNTMYSSTKNFRKTDLYKDSPFVVNSFFMDELAYNKTFTLTPIDENTFRLQIPPVSKYSISGFLKSQGIISYTPEDKVVYDKEHKYGERIKSEWFDLVINKIHALNEQQYQFYVLDKLSLYSYFKQNISAMQISPNATIIKLTFRDTSPTRAKDILNSLHRAYMDQEIAQKTEESRLILDFIDAQLDSISKRLSKSATNLETFKEKNKVVGLGEQAIQTTTQLAEYEAKLEEVQTEINILSNLQQFIRTNQDLSGLTIGSVSFADPALGTLVTKLQEQATERSGLLVDYTELHPDVQKVSQNISRLKRSIKSALRNNLRQLGSRKASLQGVISKFNKSISTMPKQEKELLKLTRHYKIDEKIYTFLLEKKASTAIIKTSTVSRTRVLDDAVEATEAFKPKRSLFVIIGLILGLFLGISYALLREYLNNTISNTDDIERYTKIPIYGIVPMNKNKKTKNVFNEAFRAIRTNLQFLPQTERNRIMAITSSVSGEGKTTITAKIAEVIGQSDKKVVVLDVDMRKASVHKEFDVINVNGLSNYLSGEKNLDEVITKTEQSNVDLITTGPLPPNPSELILLDRMKELLDKLKERYDYVILDTPPVGLVTDALILMNYVDMSFVVVRANYTRKEFIKNLDRLAQEHAHNHLGMFVNGVEIGEKYGYGYGVSYGYGYGNKQYYKDRS